MAAQIADLEAVIAARLEAMQNMVKAKDAEKDKALGAVEAWRRRRDDAPEFPERERQKELDWLRREQPRNNECLAEMRRFLPPGLKSMTRFDIQEAARER